MQNAMVRTPLLLRISHWNIGRCKERMLAFLDLMITERLDVASINEPNLSLLNSLVLLDPSSNTLPPVFILISKKYSIQFTDKTVLLVKKSLSPYHVQSPYPFLVHSKVYSLNLISLYVSVRPLIKFSERTKALTYLGDLDNLIICGDLNEQDPLWSHQAPKISDWNQFCTIKHLHNFTPPTGDNFTYKNNLGKSWIDVILLPTSTKLLEQEVVNTPVDHSRLFTVIETLTTKPTPKVLYKRVFRSFKLNLMNSELIPHELNTHSPLVLNCKRILLFPESNSTLIKIPLRKFSRGLRKLKRLKRFYAKHNYTSQYLKVKESIRLKKVKHSSSSFIYSRVDKMDTKKFWHWINSTLVSQSKTSISSLSLNDYQLNSIKDTLALFTQTKPSINDAQFVPVKGNLFRHEWRKASSNSSSTSLAADSFTKSSWKKFLTLNEHRVQEVIRKIFAISYIPSVVRLFGCTLIPKSDGKRMRLLKTPNFLLTIIDKVLSSRLQSIAPTLLLPDSQFAFLSHKSRDDFYLAVTNTGIDRPLYISLDLSNAFDEINIDPLIATLSQSHPDISQLIKSFCKARLIKLNYLSKVYYKIENTGVPQGSSSGPLIFILALDKVIRSLNRLFITKAYADDIIVIMDSQSSHIIQTQIETIKESFLSLDLKLNVNKTKIHDTSVIPIKDFTMVGYSTLSNLSSPQFNSIIHEIRFSTLDCLAGIGSLYGYFPWKVKRLLLSSKLLPRFNCLGFEIFKSKPIKVLLDATYSIQHTSLSALDCNFSGMTDLYTIYGLHHPLTYLWYSLIKWCARHPQRSKPYVQVLPEELLAHSRVSYGKARSSVNNLPPCYHGHISDILKRKVYCGCPVNWAINNSRLILSLEVNSIQLYQISSKYHGLLLMVAIQAKLISEDLASHIFIHPDLSKFITGTSPYINDLHSLLWPIRHKEWTWSDLNPQPSYNLLKQLDPAQIPLDYPLIPTAIWQKKQYQWIKTQIIEWRRAKRDFWTCISPNLIQLTSEGRLGQFRYYELTKNLKYSVVNIKLLNICLHRIDWHHILLDDCTSMIDIRAHYGITQPNIESIPQGQRKQIMKSIINLTTDLVALTSSKGDTSLIL
ncbi:uncharacterized protein LOC112539810 [Tetranychus urticae]|uniref:uncharacterized protein LOC112539810 n=1 Tax=Tetranychus urticae TaxID=32264 RepID=UPI000D65B4EB|nr:uncharacterized protein LOC112539810 [Tetranychus urticae]